MMVAAAYGRHAMVERLVVARADLNTKNSIYGCALPLGPSGGVVGRRLCRLRLRLRRPAGTQRCTLRRSKATPNPPWRCSSAAPTRPSRTTKGNAVLPGATPTGRTPNRPESAQANASPRSTSSQQARRVRRGGGGGAAAGIVHALLLQPARCASHATTRTQHCTDRALRPTPTHPRHVVRVGLRSIRWCCRTAAGRAGT